MVEVLMHPYFTRSLASHPVLDDEDHSTNECRLGSHYSRVLLYRMASTRFACNARVEERQKETLRELHRLSTKEHVKNTASQQSTRGQKLGCRPSARKTHTVGHLEEIPENNKPTIVSTGDDFGRRWTNADAGVGAGETMRRQVSFVREANVGDDFGQVTEP